jgi:hypothetical protein
MSNREEEIMVEILRKIQYEYQSAMDKFSQELIVTQIELLLIYAERFYERNNFIAGKIFVRITRQI